MTDIVERLRSSVMWYSANAETVTEAAAEIERLRAGIGEMLLEREDARAEVERLRAGGCARDQGTTQYCAEAAKLATENERLRAALGHVDACIVCGQIDQARKAIRAALEGK